MQVRIPDNIGIYRLEIIVTDLGNWLVILAFVLFMAGLTVYSERNQTLVGFMIVWLMGLPVCGLIIRMDTMIHRMGRVLRFLGDPREAFKAADKVPNLIPYGDIYCLTIVVLLVVYAGWQTKRLWIYGSASWVVSFIVVGLFYATALYHVSQAMQLGRAPLPTLEEVQEKLPK